MDTEYLYITTSIAYVNSKPHIGFALEVLQADVLARYFREQGRKVFFLTGTDEHGSKIVQTAKSEGLTAAELVERNSRAFQELGALLNLSSDDFIRTSDQERHWPAVQKMWQKLMQAGDLKKDTYQGLYCVGCEAFITEKELENGKCPNHDREPEKIEEENYFFHLGKYTDRIINLIESGKLLIVPESRRNEILNILKQGYDTVSFSRPREKLDWGVPVPGDDSQVMYVWCDALTNYISAIGYTEETEQFDNLWNKGEVTHFIGKDILRFHAAIWPAMLLSAQLPLPKRIFTHGFVTSEGKKMSKSIGNVVDPFELVNRYGVDPVRYYLLKEIPASGDGDFSENRFREVYTADLANGLGNLVSRVTNMIENYLGGQVNPAEVNTEYNWLRIREYTEQIEYDKALTEIWSVIADMNKLIDDVKPWKLMKEGGTENEEKVRELLAETSGTILEIARHLHPYLPETSDKIINSLTASSVQKADVLFPRLVSE